MRIELRKLSHNVRLSDETPCFSADVYIDGVKAGSVENRGQGGASLYTPFALEQRLDAYAKTLPPITGYGMTIPESADTVIFGLVEDAAIAKSLARKLRTRVLFEQDGALYETSAIPAAQLPDAVQRRAAKGHRVLNTMTPAEALALYKTLTAPKD